MHKNKGVLSPSQSNFIQYINSNLAKSNHIIYYKCNEHFGMQFAIHCAFPKAKVLSFKELKSKKGKNIPFRILSIITAIATFGLAHNKNVDLQTTATTILSDLENVYLGVDKEKEYLKYLHIRKIPYKSKRINYIIRISENDFESNADILSLKLLCKLIEENRINNTIVLLSGESIETLNLGLKNKQESIQSFQFTEDDLKVVAEQNNLSISDKYYQNIDLIRRFGLQFFIDNYNFFDALTEVQEDLDWNKKMRWLMERIVDQNQLDSKQFYPLLEFTSFFEKCFSKLEIHKFNNNQLEAENLDIACRLELMREEKASIHSIAMYSFKLEAFKMYFCAKYFDDLKPNPWSIFEYFREHFPFEYISALRVLHVDSSFIDEKDKLSLIVIGYYYQIKEKGIVNPNNFKSIVTKDSIPILLIDLYENFKKGIHEACFEQSILNVLNKLNYDVLCPISTCAVYSMILQILKENYYVIFNINFSSIMREFRAAILEIEISNNYTKYWQGHFKCQYIALSLEDENTNSNNTERKFLRDIENLKKDESLMNYIQSNRLMGFTRIDLLAFSLAYDNANTILENLYNSAEESSILKELARINYSAYLIENEQYHCAISLLNKRNLNFLENINVDTYCSYLNNLYLAQLGTNEIGTKKYMREMEKLMDREVNYNDKLILKNNLCTAYLSDVLYENKGIEQLKEILQNGNEYNQFLACHNLLAFYFLKNDIINFDAIYTQVKIPKLLLQDKTFFLGKFKWMKENIGKHSFENFKVNPNVTKCYNQLYIRSSLERWFE